MCVTSWSHTAGLVCAFQEVLGSWSEATAHEGGGTSSS